MLGSPNFRRLVREQAGISLSQRRFVEEARKLVPNVESRDFVIGKRGIRAQLVDRAGRLVEDVVVETKGAAIHVLNAVSPGFTCSLPFADHIVKSL
jgi:L-2-hydroxyglutarate oxidase LhgO